MINTLSECFNEIVELCKKLSGEYGNNASWFSDAITEGEITVWEENNKINIPKSYKEWLMLAGSCQILFDVLKLYSLDNIITIHNNFPDDLVIIGNVFGSGDSLCFSKTTGKFVRYNPFEDISEKRRFDDFEAFLRKVILPYLKKC